MSKEDSRTSPRERQRRWSTTLKEEVFCEVLPSGLRVMVCPKPGFRKRYASYSTYYGSVDNDFVVEGGERVQVPDGIAHYLEHVLFETEAGNVSDLFARNGAYSNASTSFTTTTYLFASTHEFYDNLKLLIDFVEHPVFAPDKVEKERGIIEQEIKGYDDSPGWVSYMGVLEELFVRHPLRIDIAGTPESIAEITPELLHRCHDAFYHPKNMILFVVGDVDPGELFRFVAEHSDSGERSTSGRRRAVVERRFPPESQGVARHHQRRSMAVAVPKLLLGFKELDVPVSGKAFVEHELASELALELLFGRGSDLYRDLYERELITDDFGSSYNLGAGVGYSMIGGDTPAPERLEEAVVQSIVACRERGVEEDEFEREKRRFTGHFISAFNSLEYIANHFTFYEFHDFDLFEVVDLLGGIRQEVVADRVEQLLDPENYSAFVITPEEGAASTQ